MKLTIEQLYKQIEHIICSTLVIKNKQSIHIAVNKIINEFQKVETDKELLLRYHDCILKGYQPDSTILEILGTDDVIDDFLSNE